MPVRRLQRHRKAPTIGAMDTPLSFYTGTAVPDDGHGWKITLTPLCERWASVDYGSGAYTKDGSPDSSETAHALTMRSEDQLVPKSAYTIMDTGTGSMVCRVVESTPLSSNKEFALVYVVEHTSLVDADVTILAEAGQPDEEGTPAADDPTVSDLWSDGF